MMSLRQFMDEVRRTMGTPSEMPYVLGLAEEVGEVVGWHKKTIYHKRDLGKDKLIEEMGDVAWYFVALCLAHKINPMDVFQKNADKLRKRYPEGFVTGGGNR